VSRDSLADLGHPSASPGRWPAPRFDHLRRLTDRRGLWEHAVFSTPRPEHGFCTEDNARALVVVSRHTGAESLTDLAATYLAFVLDARTASGEFHNRRNADGDWTDDVGSDDCQGRAWWGLGTVARLGPEAWMRDAALDAFGSCSTFASPHLRANAYAALGAAEVLGVTTRSLPALELLDRTSELIAAAARATIPWPERRLTYDNARLPEALIAAGVALGNKRRSATGIRLLEWLIDVETNGDHLSFTPVGGWEPGDRRPGFDQQPLEAWALADACYRAWSLTGDSKWRNRARHAASWLLGRNDERAVLYDATTGGTGDGLMSEGVNENRGAESTLAGLGALQTAARCAADIREPEPD